MAKTEWDYTHLATTYDQRADYADEAIDLFLQRARPSRERPVADIGAGTGKLAKLLLARGYRVCAVEPNDAMRALGEENTAGQDIVWSEGTGEATDLDDDLAELLTFGSSFNVCDRQAALKETARVLRPRGTMVCLWNHRELDDPIQQECERIIRRHVPDYGYGARREDQAPVIRASGLFEEPEPFEVSSVQRIPPEHFVAAWRSHGTLQRQAGERFDAIVDEIAASLPPSPALEVPYVTRGWIARRKD